MNHEDIIVVEDFEEAEQFRYEHNDEPVEVGTPVAYEKYQRGAMFNGHPHACMAELKSKQALDRVVMTCFDGIYFQEQE